MQIFDTLIALFATYGIVFFIWWMVALFRVRFLSTAFTLHIQTTHDRAYVNWLKYAGIIPPALLEEEPDGTGIDEN